VNVYATPGENVNIGRPLESYRLVV
jgi:hypothetical protein